MWKNFPKGKKRRPLKHADRSHLYDSDYQHAPVLENLPRIFERANLRLRLPVSNPEGTDTEMLEGLRQETFGFFRHEVNPQTGLTADKTQPGSPSSIAVVGMALSVYVLAVERNLLSR